MSDTCHIFSFSSYFLLTTGILFFFVFLALPSKDVTKLVCEFKYVCFFSGSFIQVFYLKKEEKENLTKTKDSNCLNLQNYRYKVA